MAEEYQITSSIEITASIDLSKVLDILGVPYTDLLSSIPKTDIPQVAQENLYTNGKKFKTPDGQEYIGSYHIHPIKGPMVGAFHKNTPHDRLIFAEDLVRENNEIQPTQPTPTSTLPEGFIDISNTPYGDTSTSTPSTPSTPSGGGGSGY